jgi:hypothetical protein
LTKYQDDSNFLGLSIMTYTTLMYCLGQSSSILYYFLSKPLKKARAHAYQATIESRGKPKDFWIPYVEEWSVPPVQRAERAIEKSGWYARLATPLVRMLVVRFLLLPVAFLPFVTTIVTAGLKSLAMAETLHEPYFQLKGMTCVLSGMLKLSHLYAGHFSARSLP